MDIDILQLAQEASDFLQSIEPGLEALPKAGKVLATVGSTTINLLHRGKRLAAYWIRPKKSQEEEEEADFSTKALSQAKDTAIIIEITRPVFVDVARFLKEEGIEAELIVIKPNQDDQDVFLPVDQPEVWHDLVREFSQATNTIKRKSGKTNMHMFISAPLPLAFGMGAMWGTVDRATVYHWQDGYKPVMTISRQLRY
jgi:hypothetical protein